MELMGHKCEAQKFTYDVATETWVSTSIRVSFSRPRFQEGGMRMCYKANEYDPDTGDVFESVAK
eukprot:9492311-Pyramimonas_sp.AAC.1